MTKAASHRASRAKGAVALVSLALVAACADLAPPLTEPDTGFGSAEEVAAATGKAATRDSTYVSSSSISSASGLKGAKVVGGEVRKNGRVVGKVGGNPGDGPGDGPTVESLDGNDYVMCWFWVIYNVLTGEIVHVELLWCEAGPGSGVGGKVSFDLECPSGVTRGPRRSVKSSLTAPELTRIPLDTRGPQARSPRLGKGMIMRLGVERPRVTATYRLRSPAPDWRPWPISKP